MTRVFGKMDDGAVQEPPLTVEQEFVEKCRGQLHEHTLSPMYVQWLATYKCNFRCPHCGTGATEARPDELTTDEIKSVIDALADLGCKVLSVTGGEPILRPDFFDVLRHAKDRGLAIGFVTNGFAIPKYVDQISRAEIDSVLVSLDGFEQKHDVIRGTKGAWEHAMQALDIFHDLGIRERGVSTVFMKDNLEDLAQIIDAVIDHNCTRHRFQAIVPEGRAKGRANAPEEVEYVFNLVLDQREQGKNVEVCEGLGYLGPLELKVRPYKFFCACGWRTCTICHNGAVSGCPAIDFPELNEGNIREQPMDEIWWNGFGRFRDTLTGSLPAKCLACEYLSHCRGGCWLHRVNGEHCFIDIAKKVAAERGLE